jgi:hypothetical protein
MAWDPNGATPTLRPKNYTLPNGTQVGLDPSITARTNTQRAAASAKAERDRFDAGFDPDLVNTANAMWPQDSADRRQWLMDQRKERTTPFYTTQSRRAGRGGVEIRNEAHPNPYVQAQSRENIASRAEQGRNARNERNATTRKDIADEQVAGRAENSRLRFGSARLNAERNLGQQPNIGEINSEADQIEQGAGAPRPQGSQRPPGIDRWLSQHPEFTGAPVGQSKSTGQWFVKGPQGPVPIPVQ